MPAWLEPDEVDDEAASDMDWEDYGEDGYEAMGQDELWEDYGEGVDGEIDPNFHSVFGEGMPDMDDEFVEERSSSLPKAITIGEGEAPQDVDELPEDIEDPQELVFGKRVPFKDAGIEDQRLLRALPALGFASTTRIQAAAMPLILAEDRRAVVLNSETGSGKTLAYLLPAFELVLRSRPRPAGSRHPVALIIVPSPELVFQVEAVAAQIAKGIYGREVTVKGFSRPRSGWPSKVPDIMICTPGPAATGLRPCVSEDEIVRREALDRIRETELIVLDECDVLLGGTSLTPLIQSVLVALAASYPDRPREVQSEAQVFYKSGTPVEVLDEKTLEWKKARAFPNFDGTFNVRYVSEERDNYVPKVWENYVRRSRLRGPGIGLLIEHGPHIVLACATLPSMRKSRFVGEEQDNSIYNAGIGSVSWVIKRWFPNAVRISSAWIHRRHPSIVQTDWVYIEGEKKGSDRGNVAKRIEKTIQILRAQDPGVRTLVFCNTGDSCLAAAVAFKAEGLVTAQVHQWMDFGDRIDNLKKFAIGEASILLCTDRLARGIDLPICRHVIQLEFAMNAVDHVHRVGRAARAGRMSKTTNLWGDRDAVLRDTVTKAPSMGLDGHLLYRYGNRNRLANTRRKMKRQEFAYGDMRRIARLARINTQKSTAAQLAEAQKVKPRSKLEKVHKTVFEKRK